MDPRKPIDATAAGSMIFLCGLWGTQQVAIKLAAPDMAPMLQVGLRSCMAAMIVLLVVVLRREQGALRGEAWRPGLLAGALFGLEFVLFAQGLRFTSASHMSIFLYTAPVFAALCLHFRLAEERLAPIQWLGIAIAFGGIVLSFSGRGGTPGGDTAWIGDLLGIIAGGLWGLTTLVVRTSRLAQAPAAVTLWYQLAGAAILATGSAVVIGETHAATSLTLFASLAYQTVVLSAASYLAWFSLMRRYLASRLGVLSLMTPVFGIGFGVAILGDRLTSEFLGGAAMILSGILLVSGRDLVTRRKGRGSSLGNPSEAEAVR
ncbi:membrane protein [Aureimonas endophytica]|uniref:Membrane protein n=1 Tax=Aureimonas endophytica TaxID=2027858 RepID=A0A917A0W3_9HYPH|nr:DMT family transporter [Aureimonas endophytica]GGE20322.1 membrane protein [Aureimonas endophytica]